jgi:beta-carotene hydroxylase
MIVFVGPMVLAIFNVARLGFDQHAGLDMSDHLSASRNIESRLYNLVTFNSGYHARPGLHWSRLPEFHRQIRDGIPAELR